MIELTNTSGDKFYLNAWFVLELRKGEGDNYVDILLDTGGYRTAVGTLEGLSALINKVIQS